MAGPHGAMGSTSDSRARGPQFNTWSVHTLTFLLLLIQEELFPVTGEGMCTKYWFNCLGGLSLPRKSVGRLTDYLDMTVAVYCGSKTSTQQQQILYNGTWYFGQGI